MIVLGSWLHKQLAVIKYWNMDEELYYTLGAWLQREKAKKGQMVIGFVRCKECNAEWEALAYTVSLHKLECPLCGKKNSQVVGAIDN